MSTPRPVCGALPGTRGLTAAAHVRGKAIRRYRLALALLGSVTICSHLILWLILNRQEDNALLINLSGRQRMLSQRTAMLALASAVPRPKDGLPESHAELKASVELFSNSHDLLVARLSEPSWGPRSSDALAKAYFSPPSSLDRRVTEYLGAARRLIDAGPDIDHDGALRLMSQANVLLPVLDQVVRSYQAEGEQGIHRLILIEAAIMGLTFLLLFLEARYIFRPMIITTSLIISSLERRVNQRKLLGNI